MSEPQQKAEDEMFCSSCGAIIKKAAWICPKCGVKPMRAEEAVLKPAVDVTPKVAEVEKLSLFGYHVKCLKNYANFKGRARRREFWGFTLFMYITVFILSIFDTIIFGEDGTSILSYSYLLAVLLPGFAVYVRRAHDIGKSGSWIVIYFFIYIISSLGFLIEGSSNAVVTGASILSMIFTIVLGCIDSQTGENEYDPSPKGISHEKKPAWLLGLIFGVIGLLFATVFIISYYYNKETSFYYDKESGILTDSRDGKKYKTVKIGKQIWMAENLNYDGVNSIGRCYNDDPANCEKYGRLYSWAEAVSGRHDKTHYNISEANLGAKELKGVCPFGWHLPSEYEWDDLYDYVGSRNKLRAKSGWEKSNGTDEYGFSALPGGKHNCCPHAEFKLIGTAGYWWKAEEFLAFSAKYTSMFYDDSNEVADYEDDKASLMSVRCVKDDIINILIRKKRGR
ncbi:MAG: DUF805 domain-containing protein [Fibromonadaceae bacterium]|jgi:uncharacterized protein (TIGR02145 family)|nr:DUF805 domain-containing protein [Fibromonadaceae bacterium]